MENKSISFQKSGYFTKLINDYLEEKPEIIELYNRFPSIANFKDQIEEKKITFNNITKREVLVSELENQYRNYDITELTKKNIFDLKDSKTFTITTGHQLNLFTGPLYFLYKIVSTINLCKELKIAYPESNFVPVYWMATEDHDFEEINHFLFKNKKFSWNINSKGPVGRLSTESLTHLFEVFKKELGTSENAEFLKNLFTNSYLNHSNLAQATRHIVNALFGDYGIVILDGDSTTLKKQFSPFIKDELLFQNSHKRVQDTITKLNGYPIQVNPREINLFYIEDHFRERIILEDNLYKINNTSIHFTTTEIINLLETNPEKFSPNVILRPLYQEILLPNLAYIGGGGEIAYWLELKSLFKYHKVTFPILLIRNSALIVSEKQEKKIKSLQLSLDDLFLKQNELINLKIKFYTKNALDFSEQKIQLQKQFENLFELANKTHQSFLGAVKAQEKKQLKGLLNLEKRFLKAEKKVYKEQLERIIVLQNELFPNQALQERESNFSEFYLDSGPELILQMINDTKPLIHRFFILRS